MMRHDERATMMHLIRPLLLLIGVLLLLICAERAAGDSVRIHDIAGSDGPTIKLGQVAELEGDYARKFAGVIVGRFEEGDARVELQTAAILQAIRGEGAKLGLLDLQGYGRCVVHRTFHEPARVESSQSEPAIANIDSAGTGTVVTLYTPTTVRALIQRQVAQSLGLTEAELAVTFEDRDEKLLNEGAVAGRYEVEPVVEPGLGRVSFKVQGYRGTQLAGAAHEVSLRVQKRVIAVIAAQPIGRGELISRRQVRLREVLIDDTQQAYLTDTTLVTGQVATKALRAGDLITAGEINLPVAVKKRQRVSVELNTGGIRITFTGTAQDEGAIGDSIEVENAQTKERFTATIVGRGKVVAGQSKTTPKKDSK